MNPLNTPRNRASREYIHVNKYIVQRTKVGNICTNICHCSILYLFTDLQKWSQHCYGNKHVMGIHMKVTVSHTPYNYKYNITVTLLHYKCKI